MSHISTQTNITAHFAPDSVKIPLPSWLAKTVFQRDPMPNHMETQQLMDGLWQGDPLMDAVAAWWDVDESAPQLFQQALTQGIQSLHKPPESLERLFNVVENPPDWVCWEKFPQAVDFIHRSGVASLLVLRDVALMGGYLFSRFNQSLVLTGELANGAGPRVFRTSQWWLACTDNHGLHQNGAGYQATLRVRLAHARIRRSLHNDTRWSSDRWAVPINQTDLMATLQMFSSGYLVGLRALGIPVNRSDSNAVMALWRYVGWLLGIEEKWLVAKEKQGLLHLVQSLATQDPPDETSTLLGKALADSAMNIKFSWHSQYPKLHRFMTHALYQRHLSTTSLFLKRHQMDQLGLPGHQYPWYPLISFGPRFTTHITLTSFKQGRHYLQKRGRLLQEKLIYAGKQ